MTTATTRLSRALAELAAALDQLPAVDPQTGPVAGADWAGALDRVGSALAAIEAAVPEVAASIQSPSTEVGGWMRWLGSLIQRRTAEVAQRTQEYTALD